MLQERLRQILPRQFPDSTFSFEPGDLVSQIMNFGAPTPVELAVVGPDLSASREFAERLKNELSKIAELREPAAYFPRPENLVCDLVRLTHP